MFNPRIIAFYLPQYHPTPDNDKWWGKGFTEWTNVGKAKPLFKGHYQPKVPADLGYYDLRLPEVREAQAKLAREAGIEGFCYYHYWFGDGKQELEMPFNEVVKTGKPDFPFCLCWANESWHSKFWDKDGSTYSKKLLIEQKYLGHEDNVKHFYTLLPAFRDKRYMKYNNKLLFVIYKPLQFENLKDFISDWRILAKNNGLNDFYFIGQLQIQKDIPNEIVSSLLENGLDGINTVRLTSSLVGRPFLKRVQARIMANLKNVPRVANYSSVYHKFISSEEIDENIIPTIIPNWDHSPRSGRNGLVLHNSTPELFDRHLKDVFNILRRKNNQLVFLKSWNEWGEGNYMEPDLKYGKKYIQVLKDRINTYVNKDTR